VYLHVMLWGNAFGFVDASDMAPTHEKHVKLWAAPEASLQAKN
jgi:hypothetical protein